MTKALYFGSFNPLHIGHIAIANYVLEFTEADTLVFVVTPANPLKDPGALEANKTSRLENLRKAVAKSGLNIEVSNIEFEMEPPYYTYKTLQEFRKREPENEFVLIIGADNLALFKKWYKAREILSEFKVWVYPRAGYEVTELAAEYGVRLLDAPIIEISSTMIREGEAAGKNMNGFRYQ